MIRRDLILEAFPSAGQDRLDQLETLYHGYVEWNARINLVSRSDLENLYERHILHSLALAFYMDFKPMTEVMDLGTGAAFRVCLWLSGIPKRGLHSSIPSPKKSGWSRHWCSLPA